MKVLVLGLRLVTFSPREWDDWEFFLGEVVVGFPNKSGKRPGDIRVATGYTLKMVIFLEEDIRFGN